MRNTHLKRVFGKQVENGSTSFITIFFFKPKQFTEAIPSMKKAHNEDAQLSSIRQMSRQVTRG